MSCKFIWFNLPNKIKEVIAPYKEQLSEEANNVTWFNLPNKINKIYEELSDIKTCTGIEPVKFIWYNLPNKLKALCELVECEEEEVVPTYNFDLTLQNWAYEAVTDEASFRNWLATRSYEVDNDLTNIVVTDFNFEGNRIFCNMTADGTLYDLSSLGLVNADKIGVVNGLTELYLYSNQIVTFNPSIPLPSSLTDIGLDINKMTLAGYTASEVWANAQPAFTNPCYVNFEGNIDSISGTNLEAILLTKNCVITA